MPPEDGVRDAKLADLFDLLDHDHSGEIDADEMRLLGLAITGDTELPSLDESTDQVRRADCDHNTRIDLSEWIVFGKSTSLYSLDLTAFIALMDTYSERVHRYYDGGGHLQPPESSQLPPRSTASKSKLPPLLSAKSKRSLRPDNQVADAAVSIEPRQTQPAPTFTWFWGRCAECAAPGRITCSDCHVLLCLSHGTLHAVTHLHRPDEGGLSEKSSAFLDLPRGPGDPNPGIVAKSTSVKPQHPPVRGHGRAKSCQVM